MFFTLVVTLEPVLFFRPEPAPNRRNLKAAIARKVFMFAGRSSPRLPRKSKRQAVSPPSGASFYPISGILSTGSHSTKAPPLPPSSSSANSPKARCHHPSRGGHCSLLGQRIAQGHNAKVSSEAQARMAKQRDSSDSATYRQAV